jgi:hypothetical protein
MADSVDGQPGDVRSLSYHRLYCTQSAPLSTGSSRISEVNLGPVHQIVRIRSLRIVAHHRCALRSIASVSGDLSSLTAPPFILSPVSLTEFPGAPDLSSRVKSLLTPLPSLLVRAS